MFIKFTKMFIKFIPGAKSWFEDSLLCYLVIVRNLFESFSWIIELNHWVECYSIGGLIRFIGDLLEIYPRLIEDFVKI